MKAKWARRLPVPLMAGALLSLMLVLVASAAPPAGRINSTSACSGDSTLELYTWWQAGQDMNALDALVSLYKSRYPNVTVCISTDYSNLINRLESSPPDSYQAHAGPRLLDLYVRNGWAQPVGALLVAKDWKQFRPEILKLVKDQHVIYAVPLDIHRSNLLWYNKEVLKAHHLKPPKTLDEFFEVARSLQRAGVTPLALGNGGGWAASHLFESVLLGSLGKKKYEGLWTGKTRFDGREVRKALRTFDRVVGYANSDLWTIDWDGALHRVANGEAAMTVMGDWSDGYFKSKGLTPKIGWVASPGTDGIYMLLSDTFVLATGAPDEENTQNWLKLVGSQEGQDAFNVPKGSIPVRIDSKRGLYDKYQKQAMKEFEGDSHVPSVVHDAAAPPPFPGALGDTINTFLGDHDVDAAAAALQQAACDAGFGVCP